VDSFQKGNDEQKHPGAPKASGTGKLSSDTFRSSATGPLGAPGGTRRLASGPIDAEKTLLAMRLELDNGLLIVSKLEGRLAVLGRAVQIADRPIEAQRILEGISAGEANFTKQVAQLVQQNATVKRHVQVAIYQFEQANKGLQQALEVVSKAEQYEGVLKSQYLETYCHVEKLRGQLYPLINLHLVFKDTPLLSQLIPTPKVVAEPTEFPDPPPAPGPSAPVVNENRITGMLKDSLKDTPLGNDPRVLQAVETFSKVTGDLSRVTGDLKGKLFGAFKKNPG
jgi:hypothetical protein